MAKSTKLDKKLLNDLVNAFYVVKGFQETVNFIQDILTPNELQNISRRLKIAKMLLQESSYQEIMEELSCGLATIAKVQHWLDIKGDGLRLAIKKMPDSEFKKIRKTAFNYYGHDLITKSNVATNEKLKANLEKSKKVTDVMKRKKEIINEVEAKNRNIIFEPED